MLYFIFNNYCLDWIKTLYTSMYLIIFVRKLRWQLHFPVILKKTAKIYIFFYDDDFFYSQQNSAADLSMLVLEVLEKSETKVEEEILGAFSMCS